MLRLLHEAGFVEDNASALISCMGRAMARNVVFTSDLDFYENHVGDMTEEVASFLLSKHKHTETEGSIALFERLLHRNARPRGDAVFTFGEAVVQCARVQHIKATIFGFFANEDFSTHEFSAYWD